MPSKNYWSRFQRSRISRRRLLGATAVGAAGLAVAAACGDDGGGPSAGETPAAAQPTPRPGGTLVTGTTITPTFGLDPHTDVALGLVIFPRMYGYMVHQDPRDESIILDHAESQPEISEDGLTITITLRPDINYQQVSVPGLPDIGGRTVVAQDVVASFQRYQANPFVTGSKVWHQQILDRMEATDDRTVVFTLTRPYVYSFEIIGGILAGPIIPEELTDLETVPDLNTGGIGSGPFMVSSADLETEIEIVRNPNYFNQPLPYVDGRIWRIIRDNAALKAAFLGRQVDVYGAVPNRLDAEDMAGERSGEWEVVISEEPSLAYTSFSMNVAEPPLDDVRVREAISLAIDRQDLIEKVTLGDGEILGPINHRLRGGFWGLPTSELEEAYGLNMPREERLQRARELLEDANASGLNIEIKFPTLQNITEGAQLVQQHLQEAGLNISLAPQELLTWFVGYRQGDFQTTYQPHLPYEGPDTPTRFFHSDGVSGELNFFGYSNPEIDELVERSWGEFDDETRQATLLELQRKILEEHGPMLNLYTSVTRNAYWSYVHGLKLELPGSLQQYVYDEFMLET